MRFGSLFGVAGASRNRRRSRLAQGAKRPRRPGAVSLSRGFDVLVRDTAADGRLTATSSLAEGLRDASIALICVGTPSDRDGNLSLDQLRRVCEEIAALVVERQEPLIVAIRSTVWPGTSEDIYSSVFRNSPLVRMVGNPEFLREGTAVRDFLEPSLLVVGGDDQDARPPA